MILKDLNAKFFYVYDEDQYGHEEVWNVMEYNSDGLLLGDCEDYALTLRANDPAFKDWNIWLCESRGIGHACLIHPSGNYVIDNMSKTINKIVDYERSYAITNLKKLSNITVWWYLQYGKFKMKFNAPWFVKAIKWSRAKLRIL